MSRSIKKNPITWWCSNSKAMKKWKTQNDGTLRIINDEIPSGSYYKKINSNWNSPADGKIKGWNRNLRKTWKCFGK